MAKGGARQGAGRKSNSGAFGEKTIAKRLPVSLATEVDRILDVWKEKKANAEILMGDSLNQLGSLYQSSLNLPLFSSRVQAGFPSPADDHLDASLDLNQHLIQHPAATFFVRASGNSMINAGIHNNDILVVDRSLEPKHGNIIIAALNGELTVKRLYCKGKKVTLKPENPDYPSIDIVEENDFLIWGVVTSVVHQYS